MFDLPSPSYDTIPIANGFHLPAPAHLPGHAHIPATALEKVLYAPPQQLRRPHIGPHVQPAMGKGVGGLHPHNGKGVISTEVGDMGLFLRVILNE